MVNDGFHELSLQKILGNFTQFQQFNKRDTKSQVVKTHHEKDISDAVAGGADGGYGPDSC